MDDALLWGDLLLTLLWGDLLLTLLWGDLLLTLLWGDLLLEGHRLCNSLVWGQQFCTTCVALQLLPNHSSHHPNCPSMMGVVVLQQLQGHIDR